MKLDDFCFKGCSRFDMNEFDTRQKGKFDNKQEGLGTKDDYLLELNELQNRLYAEGVEGVLVIFQAMDAAGKDGAIRYVMSGVNPAGVNVHNFKVPTPEEYAHDFLWRAMKVAPERGKITLFNRSYYEDVLIVKVHDLHKRTPLPERCITEDIFEKRYEQIRNYERYLYENGFRIIKIFLNISKDEQKKQFLQRIDDPAKNWKFSENDIRERGYWDKYMSAYQDAINATATPYAPWYVVPSDRKWFARIVISEILVDVLNDINPKYPTLPQEQIEKLSLYREQLVNDK